MINFEEHPFVKVRVKNPVCFSEVRVPRVLLECEVFINVPALKTHHLVGVTVALKNLYGVLPLEYKRRYHTLDRTEEIIVDLNIARRSDLTVVDGTYATHHLPPLERLTLNLTIAGNDPVAVGHRLQMKPKWGKKVAVKEPGSGRHAARGGHRRFARIDQLAIGQDDPPVRRELDHVVVQRHAPRAHGRGELGIRTQQGEDRHELDPAAHLRSPHDPAGVMKGHRARLRSQRQAAQEHGKDGEERCGSSHEKPCIHGRGRSRVLGFEVPLTGGGPRQAYQRFFSKATGTR